MILSERKTRPAARRALGLALQLAALAACVAAQSPDPDQPTPALTNEIAGRIAPLDVGDSRRTRHFYSFGAGQGDLELSVESTNLEGDVDVFTAGSLRPLAKVTLYAGLGSAVSRTVFLRRADSLVLRVQARTPNDAEGSYRIRLGGTFVPAVASAAAPAAPPAETAAARAAAPGTGRRVTSTGARIEDPTPAPTPDLATATAAEPLPTVEPTATNPATTRRAAGRSRSNRREGARRGNSRAGTTGAGRESSEADRAGVAAAPSDEAARPNTPEAGRAETPAPRTNARANRGRASRDRAGTPAVRGGHIPSDTPPKAAATATAASIAPVPTGLELPGTRLVLELREGGRVERQMSEVRRVAVERGLIVITLRSGRVERQPLSNVTRMSIEP